jgi:tetratricopeptide (TPR) repeat protein
MKRSKKIVGLFNIHRGVKKRKAAQYSEAMSFLERALQVFEEDGNGYTPCVRRASIWMEIADVAEQIGDYDKLILAYTEAERNLERAGPTRLGKERRYRLLHDAAVTLKTLGLDREAEVLARKASEAYEPTMTAPQFDLEQFLSDQDRSEMLPPAADSPLAEKVTYICVQIQERRITILEALRNLERILGDQPTVEDRSLTSMLLEVFIWTQHPSYQAEVNVPEASAIADRLVPGHARKSFLQTGFLAALDYSAGNSDGAVRRLLPVLQSELENRDTATKTNEPRTSVRSRGEMLSRVLMLAAIEQGDFRLVAEVIENLRGQVPNPMLESIDDMSRPWIQTFPDRKASLYAHVSYGLCFSAYCDASGNWSGAVSDIDLLQIDQNIEDDRKNSTGELLEHLAIAVLPPQLRLDIALAANIFDLDLVADRVLSQVPFPALWITDHFGQKQRLITKVNLAVRPPLALMSSIEASEPVNERTKNLVCCVDPENNLPFARQFPEWTSAVLCGSALLRTREKGQIATIGNLKSRLRDSAVRIFFFSGHGYAGTDEDPWSNGIQLSDGPLDARRILTEGDWLFPFCVVLSACHSGGTSTLETMQWVGLSYAAARSGSLNQILTTKPIIDSSSTSNFDMQLLDRLRDSTLPFVELSEIQREWFAKWDGCADTSIDDPLISFALYYCVKWS